MFVFQKFIYDNVGEWPNRYKQKKYKMYLIWPWVNSSARVNTFPLWLWCQRVVRHEDISWFPSMELLWSSEGRDWLVHPPELWSNGDRNPCNTCKNCNMLHFFELPSFQSTYLSNSSIRSNRLEYSRGLSISVVLRLRPVAPNLLP